MKLSVGDVATISDGNGGVLQAKVTDVSQHRVTVKTRSGTKGPFRKERDMSRIAFRKLEKLANPPE
jgi:16S rRNA U1498 N3-methylase RsmE